LDHQEDPPTRMQRFVRQLENLGRKKSTYHMKMLTPRYFPASINQPGPQWIYNVNSEDA
jgi:hypothetical protein